MESISLEGKQLFRQYEKFNEDTFYGFLRHVHQKFPKCYLFLDKAPQHYRSHKVRKYFKEHKDSLIPVYLPTASPEFMVLEECWNISKNDLLVLRYYPSFAEFRTKIGQYFRTKHFNMNMRNYLTVNVIRMIGLSCHRVLEKKWLNLSCGNLMYYKFDVILQDDVFVLRHRKVS